MYIIEVDAAVHRQGTDKVRYYGGRGHSITCYIARFLVPPRQKEAEHDKETYDCKCYYDPCSW